MKHAQAARNYLADNQRVDWHNQTLWMVRQKRDQAIQQIPDWEELRNKASAVKENVLNHIDTYLDQFERVAKQNDVVVYRVESAKAFNECVLNIIHSNQAKRIVKSKSMLTEECGLNHFLEKNKFEVIDTDLGERIIQFRNEQPSHIVLPAIHLKKEEIGELFHRKLDTPADETDPVLLVQAARKHLREKFLSADVAITGVNFAVADTGTVVVCTNEGNADMGVHAAKIQIHAMGIEKIIPSNKELALFIRMLARNATGQAVTSYTSHYRKPAVGNKMYIVIVDNGRSEILKDVCFRSALKCIRCGGCLNTCPVFRRSGGHSYHYPISGPIGSVLAPFKNFEAYKDLPFACSLCGSCTNVCPVKINLHELIYSWRQRIGKSNKLGFAKTALTSMLSMLFYNSKTYHIAGKLVRELLHIMPRFLYNNRFTIFGESRDLPEAPPYSFQEWYSCHRNKE